MFHWQEVDPASDAYRQGVRPGAQLVRPASRQTLAPRKRSKNLCLFSDGQSMHIILIYINFLAPTVETRFGPQKKLTRLSFVEECKER